MERHEPTMAKDFITRASANRPESGLSLMPGVGFRSGGERIYAWELAKAEL
jgi:hypothetical protein